MSQAVPGAQALDNKVRGGKRRGDDQHAGSEKRLLHHDPVPFGC